jgi:serine/threonine protein kinase/Flp pilus assembly protein TadD
MIGRVLSHFRIMDQIGAGGMGIVYVAEDTQLHRKVALKLLPDAVAADPQRLERFRHEARALASLNHPHIVTIHSIEEAEGIHFLTMEFIEGNTLTRMIPTGGMTLENILNIALPLCDALEVAHNAGIIHRDLKPDNVMVDKRGNLKILDFGLAKIHKPEAVNDFEFLTTMTQPGVVMGTVPYMSPEQIQGQSADRRSDIFALGVVLFSIATGKLPFKGNSPAEIFSSILRDNPVPIPELRPDFPIELSRIIQRCLEKKPDQRFQTAREVSVQLEAIQKISEKQKSEDDEFKIKAIAVLPLNNLSGLPEEDYFADGMTDTLITDLAKASQAKVISRTSVMQYKNTKKTLGEIARELGVDAVVEGSIFRAGDRVRINAQLVKATTDEHLWAERYDRKMEDVLALQDDVVRAIIQEVNATLNLPMQERRRTQPKIDPEVYLLVLRGRHSLEKRTEGSFRAALDFFQKAIDLDPTYAPAYVGLADAQSMFANYGFVPPNEILARSLAAVERALELDETSADAHRVLAFIHWQFQFEWKKAITEYERSLELDPNSAIANYFFGIFLGVVGLYRKAEVFLQRAAEKDPLSLVIPSVQGWILFFERRFEEAIPCFHRVLAIDPNYHLALWFMGETLVEMGKFQEGIQSLERALDLSGRSSRLLGYTGYAYGRAGKKAEAHQTLIELQKRQTERYVPPYFLALVYCGLGEASIALDLLEQAYATKDTMIRDLKADAQWDRIQAEPRFQKLLRMMDYPEQ